MKAIISLLALFFVQSANAEIPFYVCGYGTIEKIATLDMGPQELKDAPLAPSEVQYLEAAFDAEYDCDEGVELIGSVLASESNQIRNVKYEARCSKDSLGKKVVSLGLTCVEDYLN